MGEKLFLMIFLWKHGVLPQFSSAICHIITKAIMDTMMDDDFRKILESLTDLDDWDTECESCGKSSLLHEGASKRYEELKISDDEWFSLWML